MTGTGEWGSGGAIADRSLFQPYLKPGERILWVGRPGRVRLFPSIARAEGPRFLLACLLMFVVGGSVMSALFLGILALNAWWRHANLSWPKILNVGLSIGFSITAFCLAVAFTKQLVSRSIQVRALRTISYALTDRRALCVNRRKLSDPKQVRLATVDRFHHEVMPDGTGSVVFGYQKKELEREYPAETIDVPRLEFEGIEAASVVRKLAEDAAKKLTLHPTPLNREGTVSE